ncbi:MAG: hypothetical protein ACYC6P_10400 [Ignavibacteriaceae bacterium]
MMEAEHQTAGDVSAQIRALTSNFALPPEACNTYLSLSSSLRTG